MYFICWSYDIGHYIFLVRYTFKLFGFNPANLVVHSLDVWDIHVVRGRTDIFMLLSREDVDTHHVDLCTQINNNHVTHSQQQYRPNGSFCPSQPFFSLFPPFVLHCIDMNGVLRDRFTHMQPPCLCSRHFCHSYLTTHHQMNNNHTMPPWCGANLGVAMFASLGGWHLHNFAGSPLQHHKAIFAQGGTLLGEGWRSPCIAWCEVQICICHVGSVTWGIRGGKMLFNLFSDQHNILLRNRNQGSLSWFQCKCKGTLHQICRTWS